MEKLPNKLNRYVDIKRQLDATDDFYCRSYCLLNMFRAPLCPSSGAREYYTSGCCLSYLMLLRNSPQTRHTTLSTTPYRQLENQASNTTGSSHLYNTLELLMMGIMMPETCWASNKICNKNHLLHLVGVLFPHMWKNMLERGRPQTTIWRTRIACWINTATDTHLENVILTALPLQQRL